MQGVLIICVSKNSHRKRVSRLKVATYNVRTLLRHEHIQEFEYELRETRLIWDVIWIFEVTRPEECFTTLQSGHHCKTNNGQAGFGFLINRTLKDHMMRVNSISPRVAELVLCLTSRHKQTILKVYAPTT